MRGLAKSGLRVIVCIGLFIPANGLYAQPSPNQLADEIIERNNERLSGIDSIEITTEMEGFGFPGQTTTLFMKRSENGYSWLEPVFGDSEMDSDLISGVFDEQLPKLIRGAGSVSNDVVESYSVYRVEIDDVDLLNDLSGEEIEYADVDADLKKAVIWLDREELIARKINFEQQDESGGEISVVISFNNYGYYSGLPIAQSVEFSIAGFDTQLSDEEITEARRAMQQMEQQLEQMPEAQRKVIEQQLKPQMEQFEAMIESGGMSEMAIIVTEVRVNP